jgi:catechol 2,3-dioxygenase-like lactoylglutathione lyase family enzyme
MRIVSEIGRAFVAVANLEEAVAAWAALGFEFGAIESTSSCRSQGFWVEGGGLLLVEPGVAATDTAHAGEDAAITAQAARARLEAHGPGLFGWAWICENALDSAAALSMPQGTAVVPQKLSPGALTTIEADSRPSITTHPNGIARADHIVLFTGDAETVGKHYGDTFGLRPRFQKARERSYAFVKVGRSLLEIAGPEEADPSGGNFLWGLALRSDDLDATHAWLQGHDVVSKEPRPAIQGGRILGLGPPTTGVALAVMGE